MFSNRVQLAQVCRVLTHGIVADALFTPNGPTELACELRDDSTANVSTEQRVLLELSFWFWEGGVSPRIATLLTVSSRPQLRLLGSLLLALADGSAAIERWIKANGGPVGDA